MIACDHDLAALGLCSRHARPRLTADPLAEPERFVADLVELGREAARAGGALRHPRRGPLGPRPARGRLAALVPSPVEPLAGPLARDGQVAPARGGARDRLPRAGDGRAERRARPRRRGPRAAVPGRAEAAQRPGVPPALAAPGARGGRAGGAARRLGGGGALRPQISEVIPGGDERIWSLGSYRDADRAAACVVHRAQAAPVAAALGTGRSAEARWDRALAARGHDLLDALGYHGISQLETKRDPRDGRDYLIEVNARSWLWVGLAAAVGVNLPHVAYRDALGLPAARPQGHRDGLRWALLTRHLAESPGEIRRGEWTAREFLASLRPPLVDGVLDPRDPGPAVALHRAYLAHYLSDR